MKRIKRLLIDSSSVLMSCLFAAKGHENSFISEFEGEEDIVPSADDGYEIVLGTLDTALSQLDFVPSQIVLVKDGIGSRAIRRKELPTYKDRPKKNPAFLKEFNKMQDRVEKTLWSYGALSVVKDGYEADDILAAMRAKGDIIWSKDGDLMAAGDWYYAGELNPDRYPVSKDRIVVYKSLVGDTSDKIPGCPGFGKKAFADMIEKYDEDVCDDILELIESKSLEELEGYAEDFKPFKKVIKEKDTVYASYFCAKFHHPGWDLNWQARFPETNGDLESWERTETLMTAESLDMGLLKDQFLANRTGFMGLDIETYEDEESQEWGLANKTVKGPKLDVYGSHMAGLSLTCGENNEHTYYFPVCHKDTENLTLDQLTDILNLIPDGINVLVHNDSFELPIVRKHCELRFDRGWLPNVLDTQIEKSYIDERTSAGLKFCSKTYLQYDQVSYETVTTLTEILCDENGEGEFVHTKRRMNELTGEETMSYGCDDAVVTCPLHSLFRAIMDYEGTSHAFDECEQWSAYMYAESFLNGQRFDLKRLQELTDVNTEKTSKVKKEVDSYLMQIPGWPGCEFVPAAKLTAAEVKRLYQVYTGEPLVTRLRSLPKIGDIIVDLGKRRFGQAVKDGDLDRLNDLTDSSFEPDPILNMGSPKQKCGLLYDTLGYKIRIRGKISKVMRKKGIKQGNPSANEAAFKYALINDAKDDFEKDLLNAILEGVTLNTELGLYLKPYPKMPNPKDGMVHPGTGRSKATTRRHTPSGPNIAQVSKKSPIREVYDAYDDDMIWVSCDESGQELRLTAFRSGCKDMRACYPHGAPALDVHSKTAVEVAKLRGQDIPYDVLNAARKDENRPLHKEAKEARNAAKAVNFGDIFGQTERGLALKLMITEEEAKAIMEAKAKAFPGVAKWKKDIRKKHKKDGFATTLLGARKHLEFDGSWKDEEEYRSATNYEIQSPAAEQLKIIAGKFWTRKLFERYDAVYHFPVHDEQNSSCSKKDAVPFIKEYHEIMTKPYGGMDLPIESSIEIGPNFGQLKEVCTEFDSEKIQSAIDNLK